MSKWSLTEHILDHSSTTINNLPSNFDLKHKNNIHFTFSIDVSQLIINHKCNNQADIDKKMNAFLSDLAEHSYTFQESKGKGKTRKKTLDFSNILMAYHNDASDSINSQNYSVNPHFHLLIPGDLKNRFGKSTHTGIGYMHLRKMIEDTADKHNLVFQNNESVKYNQDQFTKKGATSLTWFLKRADDNYFTKKINDRSILKVIDNFEKNYVKTGNMQYYLKGMRDLQERLKRLDLNLYNQDGINLKDDYPIPLLETQNEEIKILQSGDKERIKILLKNRDNRIARALVEYSFGFDNIIIDELQSRGLYLAKLDTDIVKDITVQIDQKKSKKEKFKKTLNYHIKQDIEQVLQYATDDKTFISLMNELGYQDIKIKAKNINGSRQRVGFTFTNPHTKKDTVVYFNSLNLNYSQFKKSFIENSKKQKKRTEPYRYDDSFLSRYIPRNDDLEFKKKQSFQNKVFKTIYRFDSSVDLTGFYIDESKKEMRAKGTLIKDKGHKLSIAKQNSEDMQRNVKILLDMAQSKKWDLDTLCVNGSKEFQKAVRDEIENIQNKKLNYQDDKEFEYKGFDNLIENKNSHRATN